MVNASVCSIDKSGLVTSKKVGWATIWVTVYVYDAEKTEDGAKRHVFDSASVRISVTELEGLRVETSLQILEAGQVVTVVCVVHAMVK